MEFTLIIPKVDSWKIQSSISRHIAWTDTKKNIMEEVALDSGLKNDTHLYQLAELWLYRVKETLLDFFISFGWNNMKGSGSYNGAF